LKLRNWLFVALVMGLLLVGVSPALAQSANDVNLDDIIEALGPREGEELIFDILLYLIFFIGLINSFLIPDKQMSVSLLNFTVIGLALVSKLLIGTHSSAILEACDIGTLVIHVGIFVFPLLCAGMLRSVKGKRSKAMLPSILLGLLGGGYFFMFWFLEQRDCESTQALPGGDGIGFDPELVPEIIAMIEVTVKSALM